MKDVGHEHYFGIARVAQRYKRRAAIEAAGRQQE